MDGELVAKLTPMQRIDMIQKGFLCGREEDVRRYFAKEKPTGEALELAIHDTGDGFSTSKMGEGNMSYSKDYSLLKSQYDGEGFNEDLSNVNPGDFNFDKPVTKASVVDRMGSYSHASKEINLNNTVKQAINPTQQRPAPRQQRQPQHQEQQQRPAAPIALPKKTGVIMEAAQAKNLGYKNGVKYLNAFIRLLKQPNVENRTTMIEMLNEMVVTEQSLHHQLINEYRKGITLAESKVYDQIKGKKNV